jgi:hypothetical protein
LPIPGKNSAIEPLLKVPERKTSRRRTAAVGR